MNQQLFCNNWRFLKTEPGTSYSEAKKRKEEFRPVRIPHDWQIYDTKKLYENSTGWYCKAMDWKEATDTLCILRFEGVYMDSVIYVNGSRAFEWKYGYSTFEADITGDLHQGSNEIMVEVKYLSPNSRWYTGAGIYRNVWLKTPERTRILSDGVYIHTEECSCGYQVMVSVETAYARGCEIRCVFEAEQFHKTVETDVTQLEFFAENPKLWDLNSPSLYTLYCELVRDREVVDRTSVRFGFRTIEMDPDTGFYLNHRHLKLNGVCNHHDLGALGAAVNRAATKRQLLIEKDMGVNAIRTSHNMPSVEMLEIADEIGLLVLSEAFDMWERPKTTHDYGNFFKEWYKKDVESWIRRDRNHPCIIMWSIGNEVYDTHADTHGQELTKALLEEVYKHDPLKNAVSTFGSNYMPWENTQKCADIIKVVGYNYSEKYYDEHHKAHPDWVIYGSETSSTVQSRGIYHFPLRQSVLADEDEQCSSLGNSSTSWGAKSPEACIIAERDHPFSMGQFLWSGIDYIGEPTPYHTKNSYFGLIDTAGFPKDSYYIFQAAWTDYKEKPMIHLFPYWDFNPGQTVDVRIASNAPWVELFVNGFSQGRKKRNPATGTELLADYMVPYETGEITAVAYDEHGMEIARKTRHSFGDAKKIEALADKEALNANGNDMAFVEIWVTDDQGHPVENANNRIQVRVEGPGELVGMDNGDSTDYDQYKGESRRLFSGRLLAMVRATDQAGIIRITLSSEGMKERTLELHAWPSQAAEPGTEFVFPPEEMSRVDVEDGDCLIRKIELICNTAFRLNLEQTEAEIGVLVYPRETKVDQLAFSIVNPGGIPSGLAEIIEIRKKDQLSKKDQSERFVRKLKIRAKGDGEFLLRATTKNGKKQVRVISMLDFTAEGLGQMYLNPYELIAGGLYSDVIGTATNGNDHGVATTRGERTVVGFRDIDFGETGSDRLTLSVFPMGGPCEIKIWDGNPDAGGRLVYTALYDVPSSWNTYKEKSYQLPERLTGIHALFFELHTKIHMKGFVFKKRSKAFEKLCANQNQRIYGDQLLVTEEGVMDIGNNVTIEFDDMDFDEKGCGRIRICGKTENENNTIHLRFFNGEREIRQILEFHRSTDFEEQEFVLERVNGLQRVSFVFMPGSRFDFKWFQFLE